MTNIASVLLELPRTDQRTSPIAVRCGHADCAESPELAWACTAAAMFAIPDGIGGAGERAYRAIMAVFTQFDAVRAPAARVFEVPAVMRRAEGQCVLYVNYNSYRVSDFFRGGDAPRAQRGAMRDALEAEGCYCVEQIWRRAEIYTLR